MNNTLAWKKAKMQKRRGLDYSVADCEPQSASICRPLLLKLKNSDSFAGGRSCGID